MSYEGRVQVICTNGHYSNIPCDYGVGEVFKCSCGGGVAWSNAVDDTNCDAYGCIPPGELQKFLLAPAATCTCTACGNTHVKSEETYRVPSEEETKHARHYWDGKAYVRIEQGKK